MFVCLYVCLFVCLFVCLLVLTHSLARYSFPLELISWGRLNAFSFSVCLHLPMPRAHLHVCVGLKFSGSLASQILNSVAMGAKCEGYFPSGRPCKASRSQPGQKVCIKGPCGKCRERRCKSHCRCGRQGTAIGRSAARPGQSFSSSSPDGAPPVLPIRSGQGVSSGGANPVVLIGSGEAASSDDANLGASSGSAEPVGPIGFGKAASSGDAVAIPGWVQVLEGDTWFASLTKDLRQASSVVLGSYSYDEPSVQAALEERLRSGACLVEVLIDKEYFAEGVARNQKSRLTTLCRLGAVVRLCSGRPRSEVFGKSARGCGNFHKKLVVIDNPILYHGSANCTQNARVNGESVLRLTGHPAFCLTEFRGISFAFVPFEALAACNACGSFNIPDIPYVMSYKFGPQSCASRSRVYSWRQLLYLRTSGRTILDTQTRKINRLVAH